MVYQSKVVYILIIGLAVGLTSAASADDDSDSDSDKARHRGPQACSTHAEILRRACFADRKDDFLVHTADCVYVTSREDERDCLAEAREEREEQGEQCRDVYEARLEICELVGEPTGEREEISCIGDSLDDLDDPSCGIADPEALFDALCAWAPDALCNEEKRSLHIKVGV